MLIRADGTLQVGSSANNDRNSVTVVVPQPRVRYLTYREARELARANNFNYNNGAKIIYGEVEKDRKYKDEGASARRRLSGSFYISPYVGYITGRDVALTTEKRTVHSQSKQLDLVIDNKAHDSKVFYGLRIGREGDFSRTAFSFDQKSFDYETTPAAANDVMYRGHIESDSLAVNIGLKNHFEVGAVFVNVGGGVAQHTFSDIELVENNRLIGKIEADTSTNYLLQAGAGLNLNLSDSFSLDVNYRYNTYGDFSSGNVLTVADDTALLYESLEFDMSDHAIESGFSIVF